MAYTNDTARWRALTTRDANANGHFIYSVNSTKIYCRPTCPGRLARRANVGFYETALEAEAAGFRACKRCKPNTILEDPQEQAVEKACILINKAAKNNNPKAIRLQDLAKNVGLTPRYFHKIFKDKTGLTPKEYAKAKTAEHSSPSATRSSTGSDPSAQTVDWEIFDFNDLEDLGADIDDFIVESAHTSMTGFATEIDANMPLQPWEAGDEPNGVDPDLRFKDDNLVNSFEAMSVPVAVREGKPMAATSTLELDAAALLHYDSLTAMLLT